MADLFESHSRSARLDQVLRDLLGRAPELQAASVVSFDGLPMASALPSGMDEDRVAAMSAALLSLGERAAENFGRGSLNQVYVEGENGTVFLVSADDEAVLVAVGAKGAKVGLLMFEVRRSAQSVADALRADDAAAAAAEAALPEPVEVYEPVPVVLEAVPTPMAVVEELPVRPEPEPEPSVPDPARGRRCPGRPRRDCDPETDEPYPRLRAPEPYATAVRGGAAAARTHAVGDPAHRGQPARAPAPGPHTGVVRPDRPGPGGWA